MEEQASEHWKVLPSGLNYWPDEVKYIMFIDENNNADLKYIRKKLAAGKDVPIEDRYFTVTGSVIDESDFDFIKDEINKLKDKYWKDGLFFYEKDKAFKKVCFHSSDIRNRRGPFSEDVINYDEFILDLSDFMTKIPFIVFSATIDKVKHLKRYNTPLHPYDLCMDFLLERFGKFFLNHNEANGVLHIEARGEKEDRQLLKHLVRKLEYGTMWSTEIDLSRIKGIYFNTKWCLGQKNLKSYFGLEIADLASYPIHKYCRFGVKDPAFHIIEPKMYFYPRYKGTGLKIFP